MKIPNPFAEKIIRMRGNAGIDWLNSLADTLGMCEKRWKLTASLPFDLSYNFVVRTVDGKAVIKICLPGDDYQAELSTLRNYNGTGLCRLIDAIEEKNVLLLESLDPGMNLLGLDEDTAIRATCFVIREMQRVPVKIDKSFQTVSEWSNALEDFKTYSVSNSVPVDGDLLMKVGNYFRTLESSQKNVYLLHGDLHHENILAHGNRWKGIDPKGIVGEVEFELVPFLLNNISLESMEPVIDYRISQFSKKLDIRPDRLYAWGLCRAMLSIRWNLEDNFDVSDLDLALLQFFNQKTPIPNI